MPFGKSSGLIGHWPLNTANVSTDLSTSYDVSRMHYDGTNANATLAADGKSTVFNGSNTYIDINIGSDFDRLDGALTISCWFKINSFTFGSLFSNYKTNLKTESDNIYFTRCGGASRIHTTNGFLKLNTWYHVLVTSDATGISYIYINSVKLILSLSGTAGTPEAGTINAQIGRAWGPIIYFDGNISNVKIYSYVLSPAQVRNEYNNTKNYYIG